MLQELQEEISRVNTILAFCGIDKETEQYLLKREHTLKQYKTDLWKKTKEEALENLDLTNA